MITGEIKAENADGEGAQHRNWEGVNEPAKRNEAEGPERKKENQESHLLETKSRFPESPLEPSQRPLVIIKSQQAEKTTLKNTREGNFKSCIR